MSEATTKLATRSGRRDARTFARFVPTPENQSALLAAQRMAACVGSRRNLHRYNPLFLHGGSGTGKTHLASALAAEVIRLAPDAQLAHIAASDLRETLHGAGETETKDRLAAARDADLLLLEDLQHLPPSAAEAVVMVFDARLARQLAMVFTAAVGPGELPTLGLRLTSRLASGLVIGIDPLAAKSRRVLLSEMAQRRQLALTDDVITWVADQLGSGRQLEGAIAQLEALARLQRLPLGLATVQHHFQAIAADVTPTMGRIVEQVGGYFHVQASKLRSSERTQRLQLPRQVGMYLARQLTNLSLAQIGAYFGGRDHSTVLHACRRVEQAAGHDAVVAGAVRRLRAQLL